PTALALQFPDFDPAIFTIPQVHLGGLSLGPFPIRWYAMAYIAGILLGWRYCIGLVRNPKLWGGRAPPLTPPQVDDLILWLTLGIILGGRIGYILAYMLPSEPNLLARDPWEIFEVWHGGMSFHGGVVGVLVALIGFAVANRMSLAGFLAMAHVVGPCGPIGQFFGRLANFINREPWGRVTHVPWGMAFFNPQ